MPHLFALRSVPGIPHHWTGRDLPAFGHGNNHPRYRFVEDDDVAAALRGRENSSGTRLFRYLSPEDLEAALGSAEEAVDAIEAGEYDHILDMLLFAERSGHDSRVTVVDAIADRHRELKEQRAQGDGDEDVITPDEVTPGEITPAR